jgi:hypothetical protein
VSYGQQPGGQSELQVGMPVSSDSGWKGTITEVIPGAPGYDGAVRVAWHGDGTTLVALSMFAIENGQAIIRTRPSPPQNAPAQLTVMQPTDDEIQARLASPAQSDPSHVNPYVNDPPLVTPEPPPIHPTHGGQFHDEAATYVPPVPRETTPEARPAVAYGHEPERYIQPLLRKEALAPPSTGLAGRVLETQETPAISLQPVPPTGASASTASRWSGRRRIWRGGPLMSPSSRGAAGRQGSGRQVNNSPTASRVVRGTASAFFPSAVESDSRNLLTFLLDKAALSRLSTAVRMIVPAAKMHVQLAVQVVAPDFIVLDWRTQKPIGNSITMDVDVSGEAPRGEGKALLKANAVQQRVNTTITLLFAYDGVTIGCIQIPTVIIDSSFARLRANNRRRPAAAVPLEMQANNAKAPDVSLNIIDHGATNPLLAGQFHLVATLNATGATYDFGGFTVPGQRSAERYAEHLLKAMENAWQLHPEQRRHRIEGIGLDLWAQLPADFRRFYWKEMHGRELSIMIASHEPFIPWELVKPQREPGGETADLFGVSFAIARWQYNRHTPSPLTISRFVVFAPNYAEDERFLRYTLEEARELSKGFSAELLPGLHQAVLDLFMAGGAQAIHFAAHGRMDTDDPSTSALRLEDTDLLISDVRLANLRGDRPLIFLNACEVGQQGWFLTQIGGWATAFCDIGSTAFVGPYWAVNDAVAKKAAILFYGELVGGNGRKGKTIGQAMQAVRRRFLSDDEFPFHPTWLAYTLHCHPNVTVQNGDVIKKLTAEHRCTHCRTPLRTSDAVCPVCGTPVAERGTSRSS